MAKRRNAYQKAIDAFHAESKKQCTMLFAAASLALNRYWGMKQLAIIRVLRVAKDAWNECALDDDLSMVQMCEDETGIELQNGDGKSWHDLIYLNGAVSVQGLTYAQAVYMRQQQTKWIAPQIVGSILVAMHRKHGFGYERCSRLYRQMVEIQEEFGYNADKVKEACITEADVNVFEEVRAV